jgi:ribosome maturation factor RimP
VILEFLLNNKKSSVWKTFYLSGWDARMEASFIIKEVVEAMGYQLVEEQLQRIKGGLKYTLFIYKESGIGSEDCDKVIKALQARLESLNPSLETLLEVSSPGISRVFKSNHEYGIFKGKQVQLNLDNGQVVKGFIEDNDDKGVTIDKKFYGYNAIKKTKLL